MAYAWAAAIAAGYASSRDADERQENAQENNIETLRERFRLEDERAAANRQRVSEGYNAWGAYGMGGAQGGMWNQPAPNYQGLLAPSNFRSQYGSGPVAMPWGQPPQQNNRGRR